MIKQSTTNGLSRSLSPFRPPSPLFQPNGEYTKHEAEILSEALRLWSAGKVSLRAPEPDPATPIRMPRMSMVVAVQDGHRLRLCGIKKDNEEYCSCLVDSRDPRRCAHLWAMTFALQTQRPKVIKPRLGPAVESTAALRKPKQYTTSPVDDEEPAIPLSDSLSHLQPNLPLSPFPTRARSPHQRHHNGRTVRFPLQHNPSSDPLGLGVIELLARSPSFVRTLRDAFDHILPETLTVSCLLQFCSNVSNGLLGDHWSMLEALKRDRIVTGKLPLPDPTDLLRRIVLHCDQQADTSALNRLMQWMAEASVRCIKCSAQSWGHDRYEHWRHTVYPWANTAKGGAAPSLEDLLQCSLFDAIQTKCKRCAEPTEHILRHEPLVFGEMLIVRIVGSPEKGPTGSFHVPARFRDRALGYGWNLIGFLCWHNTGGPGEYRTFVAKGETVVELQDGLPVKTKTSRAAISAPPVMVLYERREFDDDEAQE